MRLMLGKELNLLPFFVNFVFVLFCISLVSFSLNNGALASLSNSLLSTNVVNKNNNILQIKSNNFLARDHLVIDLQSGVEWMRCSVGQVWNGETCSGEPIALNHEEIVQAVSIANAELGFGWRLPNLRELQGLVCQSCAPVKIEGDIFPNTPAEPYWTGEINNYAPRHVWSVNFFTGHTYGRFFPNQKLLVRLLRDR